MDRLTDSIICAQLTFVLHITCLKKNKYSNLFELLLIHGGIPYLCDYLELDLIIAPSNIKKPRLVSVGIHTS